MGVYADAFIKAMKEISNSTVEQQKNNSTIEGTITKVLDASIGLYEVKYLDNYFNVYSNNINAHYKINDNVYILVLNGDFEKEKIIIGSSTADINTYMPVINHNEYIEVTDDLLRIQDNNVELNTYHTEEKEIVLDDNLNIQLLEYLKNFNTLSLSCNIKTNIGIEQKFQGDYGLKLLLPIISSKNGESIADFKTVVLNTETIAGDPYGLDSWSHQNIYIKLEDFEKYDDTGIRKPILSAFVKDFIQDDSITDFDIFIKNIELKVIEVLEEEELDGYYLTLKVDGGTYFLSNGSSIKKITPHLKINGRDATIENYECYWFQEDNAINNLSDEYSSIGGTGWKCLNDKILKNVDNEGNKIYQYNTSKLFYNVYKENFYSRRYKCVLVYNGINISNYVTITDLTQKLNIKLSTDNENNVTSAMGSTQIYCDLDLGNSGISINDITYAWTRNDRYGNQIDNVFYDIVEINKKIDENKYRTTIKFDSYLIEQFNTFFCSVYLNEQRIIESSEPEITIDADGNKIAVLDENNEIVYKQITQYVNSLIGTASIVINIYENVDFHIVWENSDIVYKYDADGDSPLLADYDGPISSRISSTKDINFRIYDKYGTELSQEEYELCEVTWKLPLPNESMLRFPLSIDDNPNYIIQNRGRTGLSYDIEDVYSAIKTNNTIIVQIKIKDIIISDSITINFLKDGESGTNGTKYSAIIKYKSGLNSYSLDQRDGFGRRRNARLLYIGIAENDAEMIPATDNEPEQKWYVYVYDENSADGSFKRLYKENGEYSKGYAPSFSIDVYKDGQKINNNELIKVTWMLYDKTSSHPCFELKESKDDKNVAELIQNTDWINAEDGYCNILQARIQVTDNSDTKSDQYIYAYYPIEITRLSNLTGLSFEDSDGITLNYNGIVPSLTGGFFSVLYSSDGKNPKYDNTLPFHCVDGLTDDQYDMYNYVWSQFGDNLILKNYIDDEKEENNNSQRFYPTASWTNGNTGNYVKVKLDWTDDKQQSHNTMMNVLYNDVLLKQAWVDFYSDNQDNKKSQVQMIKNVLDEYFIVRMKTSLSAINTIFDIKTTLLEILITLNEELKKFKNFFNSPNIASKIYGYDYDYLARYQRATAQVSAASTAIFKIGLINNSNYGFDNIVSLEDFIEKYICSEEKRLELHTILGDSDYYVFRSILDTITMRLSEYMFYKNYLMTINDDSTYYFQFEAEAIFYIITQIERILNAMKPLTVPVKVTNERGIVIDNESLIDIRWKEIYNKVENSLNNFINLSHTRVNLVSMINTLVSTLGSYSDNSEWYDDKGIAHGAGLSEKEQNNFKLLLSTAKEQYESSYKRYLNKKKIEAVSKAEITHIRPIIFRMNAYEMSNLNDWDGNKIYLDGDGEGSYILAPQMGAGYKNDDNTFSGMVMGIRNLNNTESSENQVGLYGYNHGITTFELDGLTGQVSLGAPGAGQIQILPNENTEENEIHAYIQGGVFNYDPDGSTGSGMQIDLAEPSIKFGTGYFEVDKDGHLKATEATITGNIEAVTGSIGGWIIEEDKIHSDVLEGSKKYIALSSNTVDSYVLDTNGDFIKIDDEYYRCQYFLSNNVTDSYGLYAGSFEWTCRFINSEDYGDIIYNVVRMEKIPARYPNGEIVPGHYIGEEKAVYGTHVSIYFDNEEIVKLSALYRQNNDGTFTADRFGDYVCVWKNYELYPGDELYPGEECFPANKGSSEFVYEQIILEKINFSEELDLNPQKDIFFNFNNVPTKIERGEFTVDGWVKDSTGYKIRIFGKNDALDIYVDITYDIDNHDFNSFILNGTQYRINKYYNLDLVGETEKENNMNNGLYIKILDNSIYNDYYTFYKGYIDNGQWRSSLNGDMYRIYYDELFYLDSYIYSLNSGCGIYSERHTSYFSNKDGIFLGSSGLSIGKNIRLSSDASEIKLSLGSGGYGKTLYFGNDGISVNSKFKINKSGIAENIEFDEKGYLYRMIPDTNGKQKKDKAVWDSENMHYKFLGYKPETFEEKTLYFIRR